ncbi:sigma-70 family RNA polymerase sigma factor [Flavivirga aquimarina]|uniref:Sigma-70 family RNA polymerase sigma factor n=1 Tax=Flavivirga aquimarina TaxID=2027862 RepID=A0ABT8W5T9_9FLAO|nr:sigma-70 family RNA polymerase sigma factor [Flavivirga aquimarina]MDO5968475.1 sigma-70 family RNA polymerase sigma factor [Flavivirga aquimarina]
MLINSQKHVPFQELFKSLYPQLCVLAYRYVNDMELAKDLVQDVFLNLWKDNIAFVNHNHATGYCYNAVKNKCLDFIACKEDTGTEPYLLVNNEIYKLESFFMSQAVVIETTAIINNAVDTLPDKTSQEVIKLGIKDYTNNEIANELSVSVNTVKKLKKRAYLKLKKLFGYN